MIIQRCTIHAFNRWCTIQVFDTAALLTDTVADIPLADVMSPCQHLLYPSMPVIIPLHCLTLAYLMWNFPHVSLACNLVSRYFSFRSVHTYCIPRAGFISPPCWKNSVLYITLHVITPKCSNLAHGSSNVPSLCPLTFWSVLPFMPAGKYFFGFLPSMSRGFLKTGSSVQFLFKLGYNEFVITTNWGSAYL